MTGAQRLKRGQRVSVDGRGVRTDRLAKRTAPIPGRIVSVIPPNASLDNCGASCCSSSRAPRIGSRCPASCGVMARRSAGMQFYERGELLYAHGGFLTKADAIAWAENERKAMEGR
jgi:hypothetical protein